VKKREAEISGDQVQVELIRVRGYMLCVGLE
jgi:hypothetical protein